VLTSSGWPEQDDVLLAGHERGGGQVGDDVPRRGGQVLEGEVLQRLDRQDRAEEIRILVPFAAREATWRPRTAARYSSWDQPASRA
jgi:hypothetical protein